MHGDYNYDDFDIQLLRHGRSYRSQVLNAPTGQASSEFSLPFSQIEIRNLLSDLGHVRVMRRVDDPAMAAAKRFGNGLFRSLFSGELLAQLRGSIEKTSATNRGLRIRLRFTDTPELADLPWELLYDEAENTFLATSRHTPVVRFLDLPHTVPPLTVELPLRVLVVIAVPKEYAQLPGAKAEWDRLQRALGKLEQAGEVILERLNPPTLQALQNRERAEPFHVLHFIGHGHFDMTREDGFLYFVDRFGKSDAVRGQDLALHLRDHRTLRLVVLNACEGARPSRVDSFSGVAQSLLQQRIPAVVAMQFEISDDAAKAFSFELYRALAQGFPLEAALSESRKTLYREFGPEWATPALYMRAPSGVVFNIRRSRQGALTEQGDLLLVGRKEEKYKDDRQQGEREEKAKAEAEQRERERLRLEKEQREREEKAKAEAEQRERERLRFEAEQREREEKAEAERRERERLRVEAEERERLTGIRLPIEMEADQARVQREFSSLLNEVGRLDESLLNGIEARKASEQQSSIEVNSPQFEKPQPRSSQSSVGSWAWSPETIIVLGIVVFVLLIVVLITIWH